MAYILLLFRHLALLFLSLLLLSAVVFILMQLTPGDPLQAFCGEQSDRLTAAERQALQEQLGLNAPVYEQYLHWLYRAVHLDFGWSLSYKMPLSSLLPPLLGNTLILGLGSFVLIFACALALSLVCARFEGRLIDRLLCSTGSLLYFLPSFWLALLLILVFSINLHLLPSSGAYSPGMSGSVADRAKHLVLPAAVMTLSHLWYYAALLRRRLLLELRSPYILTARACGLGTAAILCRQALRSVLPYLLHLTAIALPHIAGGTYVVEAVFNYPGIGALTVQSARNHDYNVLLCLIMLTGCMVIAAALLAQATGCLLDPTLRTHRESRWAQ